ncbi:MAG TPA: head GIN domain-containing protein [Thermoanaerobaculia bacterium]|nr:head GIN domain-containing protein [Thermoanaerobaculia bacterium]
MTKTKFVFRSTTPETAVQGSGQRVEQKRDLSGFERLEVHGPFDVELAPGAAGPARLEGDDNVLPLARLEMAGSLLTVRLATDDGGSLSVATEQPISLRLPVKDLGRVQVHSTSRVRSTKPLRAPSLELETHGSAVVDLELDTDELRQEAKGNAEVTLRGRTGTHRVRASGSSEVHAFELAAEVCEARASGSATVEVQAHGQLDARASGKARIAYQGDPAISQTLSGKGQIERG